MNILNFLTVNGDQIDPEKTLKEIEEINPEKIINEIENIIPQIIQYGKLILLALLVYIIGRKILKLIVKIVDKSVKRSNMEQSVAGFFIAVVNVVLHAILIIMIVDMIGFNTSSLIALIGSAGLAIGLALQGSLSNFAGGVLILLMKPFRAGDYIITDTYEGVVSSIDIFYTRLITGDNRMVVIPNGTLSNSNIINVTNEPIRRLDLLIGMSYKEDLNKVKEILLKVVDGEELVKKDSEISIFVNSFDPSAITLGVRVWVDTDDYWIVKCNILENIKKSFDENNIQIPYNKMDIMISDNRK